MSAKPEVVGEIGPVMARVPQSVLDATVVRMEELELEVESLKRQREGLVAKNALMQEQVLEAQLQAQHQIALSKFSEAQMYQRVLKLEQAVAEMVEESNRLNNWIAGNVVQRDQEYENLLSRVSYLMGNVQV